MGANTAAVYIPDLKSVYWKTVTVTADGTGSATAIFGTQVGRKVFFVRVAKRTAVTLPTCYVQPQYDGPTTIPPSRPQQIPCDAAGNSEAVVAVFPLDPTQQLQLAVSQLDAAGVYDVSIGTDLDIWATC